MNTAFANNTLNPHIPLKSIRKYICGISKVLIGNWWTKLQVSWGMSLDALKIYQDINSESNNHLKINGQNWKYPGGWWTQPLTSDSVWNTPPWKLFALFSKSSLCIHYRGSIGSCSSLYIWSCGIDTFQSISIFDNQFGNWIFWVVCEV